MKEDSKDWDSREIKTFWVTKEMDICYKCGEENTRFFGLLKKKCKCDEFCVEDVA